MPKLEPRTAGLKHMKIEHRTIDRVTASDLTGLGIKPLSSRTDSDVSKNCFNGQVNYLIVSEWRVGIAGAKIAKQTSASLRSDVD